MIEEYKRFEKAMEEYRKIIHRLTLISWVIIISGSMVGITAYFINMKTITFFVGLLFVSFGSFLAIVEKLLQRKLKKKIFTGVTI